jgi:chromatin remodeling complex protein RSC6
MNEYEINLSQEVTAQVQVSLKIKSKKSLEEVQAEIEEMVGEWSRLARMNPSDIEGYIDGTFADELNYEGDDGGEISVEVSELSSDKKAKKSKKVAAEEAEERHANFMKGVNAPRLNVSPQLEAVVGKGPMPRMVAMTKLWDYIKKNNLSDIQNPSKINADANLQKVFGGKKQVSFTEVTKLADKHLSS